MNKQEILNQYSKEQDRLLIAKVLDKWKITKNRNKMTNTDFLDEYQQNIVKKILKKQQIENAKLTGGFEEAERKFVVFYPEKWNTQIKQKNITSIFSILEIILPSQMQGKYSHRDYLGGLMKLGIKREKIGDIIPFKEGAQIIILNEIIEYTQTNLAQLTRFRKAMIQRKSIQEIHPVHTQIKQIQITITSLRIDGIIAELANTSRTKASQLILQQKVILNDEVVEKETKLVKQNDKITIRGKGKFIIQEMLGNTKKGKYRIQVGQYQ